MKKILFIILLAIASVVMLTSCPEPSRVLEPVNIKVDNYTYKNMRWSVVEGDVVTPGKYEDVHFKTREVVEAGTTYTVFLYAIIGKEKVVNGENVYDTEKITPVERVIVNAEDARNIINVKLVNGTLVTTQEKAERKMEHTNPYYEFGY